MRLENNDGGNNEVESVSDQYTELAVEILPNVIGENCDKTFSESAESNGGAMGGVNGSESEANMSAKGIQDYDIVIDITDGVSVRRSARVWDKHLRLVSCARTAKS